MPEGWFSGQGWSAAGAALLLFAISGGILVWLRALGGRQFDPPVNREAVRWAAITFATVGLAWLVGAVAGFGGVILVGTLAFILALVLALRARARS